MNPENSTLEFLFGSGPGKQFLALEIAATVAPLLGKKLPEE